MDTLYVLPHSHFDAEVFKTREEYLLWGYSNILDMLAAMEKEKEYCYILDQVCLIQPFLEAYPEMKPAFLRLIREGRLDIVCGMYSMCDINMISGESFIRQILAGKTYCREELGVDVKIGWNIDTFGMHPQTPQIMAKAGFEAMVFNRVCKENISEFYWKALDGTPLLCHWGPLHYISFWDIPQDERGYKAGVERVYSHLRSFARTEAIATFEGADLNAPKENSLDLIRRYNAGPDPKVQLVMGTATRFFQHVNQYASVIPSVEGDMNPLFQGTYSARIGVKQWNRKMENLLIKAEAFNAIAGVMGAENQQSLLDKAWERVLFNQFHDDLCGCHVDKVYHNMIRRNQQAQYIADGVAAEQLKVLLENIHTSGMENPLVVVNTLGWERRDVANAAIAFEKDDVFDLSVVSSVGEEAPCQLEDVRRHANGAIRQAELVFIAHVPAMGYETYSIRKNVPCGVTTGVNSIQTDEFKKVYQGAFIENEFFRLEADLWRANITSLKLKATGDELVRQGCDVFGAIIKQADEGDFWQIDGPLPGAGVRPIPQIDPLPDTSMASYSTTHRSFGDARHGAVKARYVFVHKSSVSQFDMTVTVYAGVPRVDVKLDLHNEEKKVRYRTAFPTSIEKGAIVHEIPFGAIQRPEGEYPAQNWVDYSDGKKGLAVLNCGLPGNAVVDGTMLLSLMRCVTYVSYSGGGFDPKTSAETGNEIGTDHTFEYSLVPHEGEWKDAKLFRAGWERNNPLQVAKTLPHDGKLPPSKALVWVSADHVATSAVRRTADGMVVRLQEAEGKAGEVILRTAWPVKEAYAVNLMQDKETRVALALGHDREVKLPIAPFEVVTVELVI